MSDQAQKTMSGQLAMRWGLGLNVPVPICPFVAGYLRRVTRSSATSLSQPETNA
jgi:hypothetical protein